MSTSSHDPLLHDLELEVEAEIDLVDSSQPTDALAEPPSAWQFDPTDIEREEVGLRSLLGAVGALDGQPRNESEGLR
jgi:hypothetical protein